MEWLMPILICALVGIVLLVVEVFMPGFGIPGVSGFLLLLASIVMTWCQYGAKVGLGLAVIVLALMGIVISISLKSAEGGRLSKKLALNDEKKEDGGSDMQSLIGQEGVTLTPLRPVGRAEFACGRLNVSSEGEYLEKGENVRIVRVLDTTIFVGKA